MALYSFATKRAPLIVPPCQKRGPNMFGRRMGFGRRAPRPGALFMPLSEQPVINVE